MQGVVLAVIFLLDLEVAHRHQDGDRGSRQEQVEEVEGEAVHHQRTHETGMADDASLRSCATNECCHTPAVAKQTPTNAVSALDHFHSGGSMQVDQQDAQREQRQQEHGQCQQVVRPVKY